MIGKLLGHYEVVAKLGEGGMGEVYRARDARLGRDVAIKVLPAPFASDPDRRERFEREAQAVAALSHPNIVAIHDTGVTDGRAFVVMELLRGSTLGERLAASPIPARKAIDIAVQIARGLGAAHAKGLVHRDLKPDNIFLLDDGQIKILDFGLARQTAPADHSGATATVASTDPGMVMGTVGYMAPEQVRAQPVDARADVFAFGAVLYEMLSGRRAFQRETSADTMTAILSQDPPEITGSRPDLSPALDRIVRHCLEKNPNERFQSARDVAFALEALSGSTAGSGATASPTLATTKVRWPRWIAVAAALVAGLAAGAYAGASLLAKRPVPVTFTTKTYDSQWITNARFAPDGATIVFSGARDGSMPSIYAIRPGSLVPQQVGPAGAHLLAVSSRSELAVLTAPQYDHHRVFAGTLTRMTLDGAARAVLENVNDADWSPDADNFAVIRRVNGQSQLEYPIGRVLYKMAGYLSDLRVSPDGTRVAFFEHQIPQDDRGVVKVIDQSGKATTLTKEYAALQGLVWTRDGRVLFAASDANWIQPYVVDAAGRSPAEVLFSSAGETYILDVGSTGQMLVTRNDRHRTIWGRAPGAATEREYSWLDFPTNGVFSSDGHLMVFTDLNDTAGNDYQVALRRNDGSPVVRLGPGGVFGLSPDGKWALSIIPSIPQIVLYPTGAGSAIKLERGPIASYRYVGQYFADGKRVLLCGTEISGESRCYQQSVTGGAPAPITPNGVDSAMLAPDDATLVYRDASGEFWLTSLGGTTAPRHALGLTPADRLAAFSKDSRSVFVQVGNSIPLHVDRIDLLTGVRTSVADLAPPDRSGVTGLRLDQWADDGRVYTYRAIGTLSTLFVVEQK